MVPFLILGIEQFHPYIWLKGWSQSCTGALVRILVLDFQMRLTVSEYREQGFEGTPV